MAKRSSVVYPEFLGVGLTAAQAQALDRLAQESCRTRSDLIRFLITRACRLVEEEEESVDALVGEG